MAELNINATTTPTKVSDYKVGLVAPDGALDQKETFWDNVFFTKYFGNYKNIAKIKNTMNTFAAWVLGKGHETDAATEAILDNIIGWGEDTFQSILWNMLVMKKVAGDSYAQIIRDENTNALLNIKVLNPEFMRHVAGPKNTILRYEYRITAEPKKFRPEEILHFCNDRVANEIHGVSALEAVQWNIEATEEARRVHRKKVKNSGIIGVFETDMDNTSKMTNLKPEIKKGVEEGTFLLLPKGVAEAKPWDTKLNTNDTISWLKYLDDDFYTSIGVPRVIVGGETGATEAGAKVSYIVFEPIYTRETTELELDLWNQLAIRITFKKPGSMMENLQENEKKNTGQTGFQPNDVEAGSGEA